MSFALKPPQPAACGVQGRGGPALLMTRQYLSAAGLTAGLGGRHETSELERFVRWTGTETWKHDDVSHSGEEEEPHVSPAAC